MVPHHITSTVTVSDHMAGGRRSDGSPYLRENGSGGASYVGKRSIKRLSVQIV